MARISGVDLPQGKRVEIALTYIFGIGRSRSTRILTKAQVEKTIKVKDLSEDEVRRIRDVIPGLPIPAAQFETMIATCRDLEREDVIAVEVLVEAVVVAGLVGEE